MAYLAALNKEGQNFDAGTYASDALDRFDLMFKADRTKASELIMKEAMEIFNKPENILKRKK